MKKMILNAETDRMDEVIDFINAELEEHGLPMKTIMQIDIAVDEIFGNIANYAYAPEIGEASVSVEVEQDPLCAVIRFTDHGKPFDPLQIEEPDITLGIDERKIGGLGIYMVRKSMDEVSYAYEDGLNILTIRKRP